MSRFPMRFVVAFAVAALLSGHCLAQTSGGGSGGAAGGSGASAPSGTGGRAAAPPAPATGTSPSAPSVSAPGVANTPTDPQRNNVDARPPSERLPGSTATEPGGSSKQGQPGQAGSAENPNRSDPSGASSGRPAPGGANSSQQSRKDAAQAAVKDCIGLWDKDTHMTRAEWRATCRRIQSRLDSVTADIQKQDRKLARPRAAERR